MSGRLQRPWQSMAHEMTVVIPAKTFAPVEVYLMCDGVDGFLQG
jgi:hypothetical protein